MLSKKMPRKARARTRKAFVACLHFSLHSAQGRSRLLLEESLATSLATWPCYMELCPRVRARLPRKAPVNAFAADIPSRARLPRKARARLPRKGPRNARRAMSSTGAQGFVFSKI